MWFSPALVRRVHFHRWGRLRNASRPLDSETSSRPSVSGTVLVLQNPEQLSSYGLRNSSRLSKSRTALVLPTPETALVLRTPEQLSSFDSRTALVPRTPEQLSSFGIQNIPKQLSSSGFWNSMSRPHSQRCFHNSKMAAKSKCINRNSLPSFYIYILGTGAQDGHLHFHTVPELCVCFC